MKKYSLIQILEASFAAHRINGDYYRDTRRFSEDVPTQFSNKECIGLQFAEEDYKIPNDWQPMKITEEDTKNSIASVEWINKAFALQVISDTLSDYMKQLMECINSKELSINEFGIVAPLPRIYFEGKRKKALKTDLKEKYRGSKHISTVGSNFSGQFTLNEIRFVERYTCHVLNGSVEGNLVSFFKNFDQTKDLPKEGTTFSIKGKVKRHGENFITKFPETILNYVRIG